MPGKKPGAYVRLRRRARDTHHHNMIIPVRCFTCNRVLANKWLYYERRCKEIDAAAAAAAAGQSAERGSARPPAPGRPAAAAAQAPYLSERGKVLDELGLTSICCRRHMLTHVDMIDVI